MARIQMSVAEYKLLLVSLQREALKNPGGVSVHSRESTFFTFKGRATHDVYIFLPSYGANHWPTLGKKEYEVKAPWFFSFKDKALFQECISILRDLRGELGLPPTSVEEVICDIVPSAKDIIAEKILVEDD